MAAVVINFPQLRDFVETISHELLLKHVLWVVQLRFVSAIICLMVKKYLDMQIYLHIYIYDINISSPFQKTDSIRMLNLFKQISSILSTKVRMEAS